MALSFSFHPLLLCKESEYQWFSYCSPTPHFFHCFARPLFLILCLCFHPLLPFSQFSIVPLSLWLFCWKSLLCNHWDSNFCPHIGQIDRQTDLQSIDPSKQDVEQVLKFIYLAVCQQYYKHKSWMLSLLQHILQGHVAPLHYTGKDFMVLIWRRGRHCTASELGTCSRIRRKVWGNDQHILQRKLLHCSFAQSVVLLRSASLSLGTIVMMS